jgi:hypothetical protein
VTAYTRLATVHDIKPVAAAMREEDKAEVMAGCGQSPDHALLFCYFKGSPCMTMVGRSGRPVGMWGVVDQGEGVGRIWLLATDELVEDKQNSIQFLRQAKPWLAQMFQRYEVLFNCADARNQVHIKWLRWMGFTFIAEHPNYGNEGRSFLEFVKVRHV